MIPHQWHLSKFLILSAALCLGTAPFLNGGAAAWAEGDLDADNTVPSLNLLGVDEVGWISGAEEDPSVENASSEFVPEVEANHTAEQAEAAEENTADVSGAELLNKELSSNGLEHPAEAEELSTPTLERVVEGIMESSECPEEGAHEDSEQVLDDESEPLSDVSEGRFMNIVDYPQTCTIVDGKSICNRPYDKNNYTCRSFSKDLVTELNKDGIPAWFVGLWTEIPGCESHAIAVVQIDDPELNDPMEGNTFCALEPQSPAEPGTYGCWTEASPEPHLPQHVIDAVSNGRNCYKPEDAVAINDATGKRHICQLYVPHDRGTHSLACFEQVSEQYCSWLADSLSENASQAIKSDYSGGYCAEPGDLGPLTNSIVNSSAG